MKILYLTLDPPLDPALVARGNAIRAAQLQAALEHQGHEVVQVWRTPYDQSEVAPSPRMYEDRERLAELIAEERADLLLVGYWVLLEDLPETPGAPVVVDFIAPRPLEAMFEPAATRDTEMRRLLAALARADGFIVANERQEHLLIPYLLMAGHDLRHRVPVAQVPIAAVPPLPPAPPAPVDHLVLVGGGVEWPWRRQRPWFDVIARHIESRTAPPALHLVQFGGSYPKIVQRPDGALDLPVLTAPVYRLELASYADYCAFLAHSAHVGVELAERNVERYFSQSFRAVDYLSHGLPLICNDYLHLAALVAEYDAGWVVAAPGELTAVLAELAADPAIWRRKSAGARRLAEERLNACTGIVPLLELVRQLGESGDTPGAGAAFSPLFAPLNEAASTPEPPPRDEIPPAKRGLLGRLSLKRMMQIVWRAVLRRLPKPGDKEAPGNVVIVSRSDLYPTDHGGAVKIVETARGLSHTGRDVGIVSDRRDVWWHYRAGCLHERRFPWWLRLLSPPRSISTLFYLSHDVPRSNAFLYLPLSDDSFIWRTLYVAHRLKANVYQAEFPAYARPCIWARSLRGGRVVLVEHNVEYARLKEQEPHLTAEQFQRLRQVEIQLCNQSDAVICVSGNDRRRLRADGVAEERIHCIPHGVDLATFDQAQPDAVRRELGWPDNAGILVYHGTYEYPPNLEAVRVLAREVLPRLKALGIDVRVLAVGKKAPAESIHEDVHFTGSVPRVATALKAADVAVVPLLKGGGTRMKIIDYFACGVPVVSTSKGIEGIPIQAGREAFVEDDWSRFTERIATLLTDTSRRQAMIAAARAFVEPLDWHKLAERYIEVYRAIGRA